MKKFFVGIIAILIVSTSLSSCSYLMNSNSKSSETIASTDVITNYPSNNNMKPNDSTTETNIGESSSVAAPVEKYKAKMDINRYMQYFVNYFHEPFTADDALSDKNILSIGFLFALSNKDAFDFVNTDEQDQTMSISGDGLRMIAKNLFGEKVQLSDFHQYMENSSDIYLNDKDIYIVFYGKGFWGGDLYYLDDTTELQITETDKTLTVIATVQYIPQLGTIESVRKMSYTFDKVVENDFMFYRISEIELVQ